MERIALIFGTTYLYWSSIILTLAAAAAICLFLALYLREEGQFTTGFLTAALALLLSVAASRMLHWYGFDESYPSFLAAMANLSTGGFALLGAFAGCLLAAVLTRVLQLHDNLPKMLDCMCLAGGAGIAVGRLASFFNTADRGQIVQSIQSMPWVYPVTNTISGVTEYRLATFLLQAMITGLIVLVLTILYLKGKNMPRKDGDTTLLFLLCYGAAEVVLDSTRYDSMFFRFNGFVSIVQVVGALALGFVIVMFSIRLVKRQGFHRWYIGIWVAIAALIGCAGYMEYFVQRHGNEALSGYIVMSICLCLLIDLTIVIRQLAETKPAESASLHYLTEE